MYNAVLRGNLIVDIKRAPCHGVRMQKLQVTSKNFIVANAVENILAAPKKMSNNDMDFLNKEDFGKVLLNCCQ